MYSVSPVAMDISLASYVIQIVIPSKTPVKHTSDFYCSVLSLVVFLVNMLRIIYSSVKTKNLFTGEPMCVTCLFSAYKCPLAYSTKVLCRAMKGWGFQNVIYHPNLC